MLVLVALAATVVGVAAVVGPPEFDRHLALAGHTDPDLIAHGEQAFVSAGLVALGAGLAIAGLGALGATALLTRRIGAALAALAAGAARVAAGDYGTPVALPADRELQAVAAGFNAMAAQIASTEATRRRLLTDLAHELRTPLAAIELLLEGLEDGVVPADAATTATLRAQTARLARLATDVRDVSAAEEGRLTLVREPVPLPALLADAVATAAPAAEAGGVRLEADPPPDVTVAVDRTRIGQALDNLLRNAVQHTPSGRRVRLWADAVGDAVRIGVRDEGAGIAAEDLPHVFERFYRGGDRRHDQGAGSGVGLAISRAIVAAHGGTLTAASDGAGRGAEFVLTLPRGR
nr:HAMP domain-containing histidine kinase [Propionibacterium sp.]